MDDIIYIFECPADYQLHADRKTIGRAVPVARMVKVEAPQ